jgi:hypothetical protein
MDMKRNIVGIAVLVAPAAFLSCGVDTPGMLDGRAALVVTVADTSGFLPGSIPGERFLVDSAEVRIESRTHIFTATQMTGPDGVVTFDHLDTGVYSVFATRTVKLGSANKVFTGGYKIEMQGDVMVADTIDVKLVSASQLMINEIYYMGSCASMFYLYDQFVELANTSDDTLYLDGMLVMRAYNGKDPELETVPYVKGTYAYQFPGAPLTGREHPIYPKQIIVLASDATNHAQFCATSIDLRHADLEMFNAIGHDFDNPAVPNLENIILSKSADFLIGMGHNGVFLTTGDEYTIDDEDKVRVPIENVIDGVEYNANPQYSKEITVRVDAGFAGIGLLKYSSNSIERREFGLDTNDSTFDFTNLTRPTPGYFHAR